MAKNWQRNVKEMANAYLLAPIHLANSVKATYQATGPSALAAPRHQVHACAR
jgi:hypothetical protein